MDTLNQLPNIGKTLADKLKQVGIHTPDELKAAGSENALLRIKALKDAGACINMLYALEGAIQGIRWHGLDPDRKNELKSFINTLGKNK